MRNIDRLAFAVLFGLCAAAPLHAATSAEEDAPVAPQHCLNLPVQGGNLVIDSCSNSSATQEGKAPDKSVPDRQGDDASIIEKGVPDQAGDVAGSAESAGLENGVSEEGTYQTTGSRRIMWRQIM